MLPQVGPVELIIILVIVLIIFGAGKLADIGGALGKGISEFRKSSKEVSKEAGAASDEPKKDGDKSTGAQ